MEQHEAAEIADWFVHAFPNTRIESGTIDLFVEALLPMEVTAASQAASLLLKNERRFPTIAVLTETYRSIRRQHLRIVADTRGIEAPAASDTPGWVKRWQRARAAGDQRLFPEQTPGIRELHLEHGSPQGSYAKDVGYPSGYEEVMRTIENIPVTDAAHWVQPVEYLD